MKALMSAAFEQKPSKSTLSYFEYHIRADRTRPDEEKLHALSEWRKPNTTETRSFVRFCSYYKKFPKKLAGIIKPLPEPTKIQQQFHWNKNSNYFLDDPRAKFPGAPILDLLNYQPTFSKSGACNSSIPAVL